jgi:hypothetical protein
VKIPLMIYCHKLLLILKFWEWSFNDYIKRNKSGVNLAQVEEKSDSSVDL